MPRRQTPPKKRKARSCASRGHARGAHDEYHLLALAGKDLDQIHPAVAQPHVRRLHPGRRTRQTRVLVAPVELVGLARIEDQRHKGLRRQQQPPPAPPGPGIAANRVIAALVARRHKVLMDLQQGQAVPALLLLVGLQLTLELFHPRPKLRHRLDLARVAVRGRIAPHHLAYRVLGNPQIPGELLDRNALHQMIPTDLRDRFHNQHLPPHPVRPNDEVCSWTQTMGVNFGRRSPPTGGQCSTLLSNRCLSD